MPLVDETLNLIEPTTCLMDTVPVFDEATGTGVGARRAHPGFSPTTPAAFPTGGTGSECGSGLPPHAIGAARQVPPSPDLFRPFSRLSSRAERFATTSALELEFDVVSGSPSGHSNSARSSLDRLGGPLGLQCLRYLGPKHVPERSSLRHIWWPRELKYLLNTTTPNATGQHRAELDQSGSTRPTPGKVGRFRAASC